MITEDEVTALKKRLEEYEADKCGRCKERVEILNDLARVFYPSDPEKAELYATQALSLARELNYKKGIAGSYRLIGNSLWVRGDYRQTLKYMFKALEIYEEINDKQGVMNVYGAIGVAFKSQGDYEKALDYQLKSLEIATGIGNKHFIATSYGNIGVIYKNQGDYDKALEYYLKSLEIQERIGNKRGIATCYGNVGVIYKNQGSLDRALDYILKSLQIYEEIEEKRGVASSSHNIGTVYSAQKDYDKALAYHLKALRIREEIVDRQGIAGSCGNIGNIYANKKDHHKAMEYHLKALEISKDIGDKQGIAAACSNIGLNYIELKEYSLALEYLEECLRITREIGAKEWEMNIYRDLSRLYEVQGVFHKALYYYKEYSRLREIVFGEKSSGKIAYLQVKYETEKKEREAEIYRLKTVELEERVAERTAELAAANMELRNQIAERERMEKQLIRSAKLASLGVLAGGIAHQINNPLAIISSSSSNLRSKVEKNTDVPENLKYEMNEYMDAIEHQIRRALETIKGLLAFARDKELRITPSSVNLLLSDALQMLMQRYDSKNLSLTLSLDKSLPLALADPEALRQVFINVIQNAIEAMEGKGELAVSTSKANEGNIQIIIHDSGPGIEQEIRERIFDPLFSTKTKSKGTGLGLSLSVMLLERFGGRIWLEESAKGARFVIEVPSVGKEKE